MGKGEKKEKGSEFEPAGSNRPRDSTCCDSLSISPTFLIRVTAQYINSLFLSGTLNGFPDSCTFNDDNFLSVDECSH